MSTIEKSIAVGVPVRTAYDQWTQFESFPSFMDGVKQVKQKDDKHLHWHAEIGGVGREWDAEIVHQEPDDRITWRATDGTQNAGTVSFAPLDGMHTRVTLRMDFEPEGLVEHAGDLTQAVDVQVDKDLKNFKEFIEHREAETGAWRGEIKPGGQVDSGPTAEPGMNP